ncbi:MAG: hypothetical protein JW795_15735, partial [Chitinivibrionales bacterium]|nr:hypothetical protein [Chitinivibrionales bacterium]
MKTRSSQTILWLVQRATAVVLCAALLFHFHFTIGRFAASGGLNYQELLNTLHQPLIKIVEIITFACALS